MVSALLRAGEPPAVGQGQAARERQARVADHTEQWADLEHNGLTSNAIRRAGRAAGVVITLRSNCRWRSDQLEIRARDGGAVRVLFDVDACEREIIVCSAIANGSGSGEIVRDLTIAAVERRLGA
jgi:putative transposase